MWKRLLAIRLLEKAGDDGGAGGGGGSGDAAAAAAAAAAQQGGTGDGKGGAGTILDSGKPGGQQQQGGAKPGEGAATPWKWGDNLDGQGTVPPWFKADKFKTVEAQARAAVELEGKLGKAAELLGAPEGGVYKLPDVKISQGEGKEPVGWVWNDKDPMLVAFNKVAGEMGLSQTAYDKISGVVAQAMAGQQAAEEASLAEALAQIGNNVEQRVDAVNLYLTNSLSPELAASLNNAIGLDPNAFVAVEKLVAKLSGDARLANTGGAGGPAYTRADVEAEQYKVFPSGHPMAGKSMYDNDTVHREKVDKMWKELFPGEDRKEVG